MRIDNYQPDGIVLAELGDRLTRARLDRNLSQVQLARDAGVSRDTVQRLEAGESVALTAFVRIMRALGILPALDVAIPQAVPSPIEQLDRGGRERQRASASRDHQKWRWGTP